MKDEQFTTLLQEITGLKKMISTVTVEMGRMSASLNMYQRKELSVKEAAVYLNIKERTVHNLVSDRKLGGFKKGKYRFFTISELEDYLQTS